MKTRRKRRLMCEKHLAAIHVMYTDGVPLAKLIRTVNNEVSAPTLKALLIHFGEYKNLQRSVSVLGSNSSVHLDNQLIRLRGNLFPSWLRDTDSLIGSIQSCPDGVSYFGKFPTGSWSEARKYS